MFLETIQITTSDLGLFETTNMDTDCDVPSEKKDELLNATPTSSKAQHKTGTWAKYTPAMLQAPKHKSLTTENTERSKRAVGKNSLGYRLEDWAHSKIALAKMQQKCFLEEHNLKLMHMKEQHQHHLQLQDRDAEERSFYLKKENEMKLELLQLEKQVLLKKLSM